MSFVTNVILTCAGEDAEDQLAAINQFDSGYSMPSFADVSEHAAGPKHLEGAVLLGAFNYLDEEKLAAHLQAIPWRWPGDVAVFVKHQDDDAFTPWHWYDDDGNPVLFQVKPGAEVG